MNRSGTASKYGTHREQYAAALCGIARGLDVAKIAIPERAAEFDRRGLAVASELFELAAGRIEPVEKITQPKIAERLKRRMDRQEATDGQPSVSEVA